MRSVMVFPGLLFLLLISISSAQENNTNQDKDPLDSFMWELYQDRYLSNAPVHFDSRVKITAPDFAEDSGQVPVEIDARHLNGKFEKMLLWVELNPIPMVFEYNPGTQGLAKVGLNIRLEQGSPVRVALLSQGVWHVGSTFIDGAGGGCSTPGIANSGKNWSKDFGQVRGRRFPAKQGSRLRFLIIHPMESGLLPSEIPFYIEELKISSKGETVADMKWHASISENPVLTIEMKGDERTPYKMKARDNNANLLESQI